jgi:hypothetical protein
MKSIAFRIVAGLALLSAGAGLFWQQQQLRRSREENAQGRARAAELDSLREEVARLRQTQIDPAELQRLRQLQSEMLRLRGETSQLRRQLKEEQQAKRAAPAQASSPTSAPAEAPVSPVETYSANLRASLLSGQTLVAGGWSTADGKRTLLLVEPVIGGADMPGTITIQARFAEMPEEVLSKTGLGGIKSNTKESSAHSILNPELAAQLVATLQSSEGVNILSVPSVSTLDGRQAQIKTVNLRTFGPGETHEMGPVVNIVPNLSPDGRSVELNVIAQLKLESVQAR